MIEVGIFAVLRAHAPAAIDHKHHLLVALILIITGNQPRKALARLPIDLALRIALLVFAQLVEVQSLAAAPALQHAHLREAIIGREQSVAGERSEIRIDTQHRFGPGAEPTLPESERRIALDVHPAEMQIAAALRAQAIRELHPAARRSTDPPREALDGTFDRVVIEQLARH